MRIHKVVLTNVRSFLQPTAFLFRSDLNILIGPNGGGKSNLLEILALVLNEILVPAFSFSQDNSRIRARRMEPDRLFEDGLEPHFDHRHKPSSIELSIIVGQGDAENISRINAHIDK